jgi:dTDP-4-dehydrorhamnose reductase
MSRWLITGANGLVGRHLSPLLHDIDTTALGRDKLDVTNAAAVLEAVAGHDVVIHLAAWTDTDGAEARPAAAMAVNAIGASNVARACKRHQARMIHISSDYVFDGMTRTPYREDDPVCPISVYGRGKASAERSVLQLLPEGGVVLRTAWLYGAYGKNFVSTMRQLAETQGQVDVVNDQVGQPTWAADLAQRIIEVVHNGVPSGIYHATNAGSTTWFDLAQLVFKTLGHDPRRVNPTTSDKFVRAARRPAYSVLSHEGWRRAGMLPMRHWRDAFDAAAGSIFGRSERFP